MPGKRAIPDAHHAVLRMGLFLAKQQTGPTRSNPTPYPSSLERLFLVVGACAGLRAPFVHQNDTHIYIYRIHTTRALDMYVCIGEKFLCTLVTRKHPSQQISPRRLTHLSHQRLGGLQR